MSGYVRLPDSIATQEEQLTQSSFPRSTDRSYVWQERRVNFAAHPIAWPAACVLRRFGPVVRIPGLGVVINDALIAHDVLTRDREFPKNGPGSIADVMTRAFGSSALANMDGTAHRELRQMLGPLASAAQADEWLLAARGPFDTALGAIARGERVDICRVSRLLSGRLTLTLMGCLPDDPAAVDGAALNVHALGERIASSLKLSLVGVTRSADAIRDSARLLAYADHAFSRSDLPASSLVGRLKTLGCDAEQTRGVLSIFFVAGALTLGIALPRVVALLVDSGQLRQLRHDSALVPRAVDEGLRYTCPVPATVRIAAENTKLAGMTIRSGERVVIVTANLARDPQLFPLPEQFDVTRKHDARARYLWYGSGPHFCLGFTLAQRVLQYAVGSLAAIPGDLAIVSRKAARGVLLPSWARLQVEHKS